MKLYNENNPAPNPRKVRIFCAEKGITLELVHVPMAKRAHKAADFMAKNSLGQLPVLELDDGRFICESVSICRYLEALHPATPLFGTEPYAQAMIDMWIRRAEFRLSAPVSQVWRNADARTAHVLTTRFADFGEHSRGVATEAMSWLDSELADGRAYLAGETFSMADIILLCGIDFAAFVKIEMPDSAKHLRAWHQRVSSRPSARA